MPTQRNIDEAREDFAIVVGIGKYPNLGQRGAANDLSGPAADALLVARWLRDEAGVPPGQITCVTSEGVHDMQAAAGTVTPWVAGDTRPRREDIEGPLAMMVRKSLLSRNSGPSRLGRRLWVYCAGHGFAPQTSTRDVALLVADALSEGYIPNLALTKFVDWVAQLQLFDEAVLWLDCCAEARPGIALGVPASQEVSYASVVPRLMMTAAQYSKLAFEDTTQVPQGIFTNRLLGALRGGVPLSPAGYVTSEAIRDFFQNAPAPQTGNPTAMQRPRILECDHIDLVHLGEAVASSVPVYRLELSPPPGTMVRILDCRLAQVAEEAIEPDGSVSVPLTAGIYKVEGPENYRRLFQIDPGVQASVSLG